MGKRGRENGGRGSPSDVIRFFRRWGNASILVAKCVKEGNWGSGGAPG